MFKAATRVVLLVLEMHLSLTSQVSNSDLTPTLSQPSTINLVAGLALRCNDKEVLKKVDGQILFLLSRSELQSRQSLMVALVRHLESTVSIEHALDICKTFRMFKSLTQIAYRGGQPHHFNYIYSVVNSQEYKLEWAMREVFE